VIMNKTDVFTPEYIKSILTANFETGELFWKERPATNKSNNIFNALYANKHACTAIEKVGGYLFTKMAKDGVTKIFRAHQLIWALYYGDWAKGNIDHINHNKQDNRICNLRITEFGKHNQKNRKQRIDNTSGFAGVYFLSSRNKWSAWIGVDGNQKYLGIFSVKEDAIKARKKASLNYGYHAEHGMPRDE